MLRNKFSSVPIYCMLASSRANSPLEYENKLPVVLRKSVKVIIFASQLLALVSYYIRRC